MKIKMDLPEADKKLVQEKKWWDLSVYMKLVRERERERERESKSDETCESFLSNL